jgi:hypothetical protein
MPRYILADDPGKATGLAFFSLEAGQEPVLLWSVEVDFTTYAAPIRLALEYPDVEVVCERFVINAKTVQNSQAPFSLEEIGVLKQLMLDAGISPDELTFQSPADAKAMFPNPALKKLGYWHTGEAGHALDAIRHGLLYMAKTGWKPSRLLD